MSGNELGNQASAIRAGVLLMGVTAAAGIAYVGLQQEIVFDEHGISVTGWFRRIRRRRSSIVPWATVRRATVGHVRSIRLETDGRRLEIHGTWLSEQDIRRVIEALRSHGVPVAFKRGARGLDDERRAVVWYRPGGFLVPTLRRAVDGATVETEPLREVAVDPALLHGALAAALRQPPAPMGPRSRPVDVRTREPDARRVVVAGSARVTTIRIDGFAEHWWVPGPPDAWTAVALILDVFELIEPDDATDAGLDLDGAGSLADGSSTR